MSTAMDAVIGEWYDGHTPVPPLDVARVFTPHPGPQAAFLNSDAYEVLYGGAAGGGKTDALLYGPLDRMHLASTRVLFLRTVFKDLTEITDRAHATFPSLGARWDGEHKRYVFPSGATFEFGYAERYGDVVRQFSGQEYTHVCYDELGQVAEERMWTFLNSRLRSTDPHSRLRIWASCNPGGVGHAWIKKRFIDLCSGNGAPLTTQLPGGHTRTRAVFFAKLSDNPALMHNTEYVSNLHMLPDVLRRQLEDGDWSAGEGLALSELNREVHLVPSFAIPDRWYQWGAFDWGFNHPFCFGRFASDPDGVVYLVESVFGRRLLPPEIAGRILAAGAVGHLARTVAGHDIWQDHKARGQNAPTVYEQLRDAGVVMQQANIARVSGLNNMRAYLTHDMAQGREPRFWIMDTPNNRRVFECLESMVVDPDHPEDALKRDADDYGVGGDDAYDMVRYGLAARPLMGKGPSEPDIRVNDPRVLAEDHKMRYTIAGRKERKKRLERETW